MYRKSTLKNLDIDWFVCINNTPIHIASNGGQIPQNTYRIRELEEIYNHVLSMPKDNRVAVDTSYIEGLDGYDYLYDQDNITEFVEGSVTSYDKISLYSESFVEMAKRGFFSFDRTDDSMETGYELYRLIAWPENGDENILRIFQGRNIPLVRIVELSYNKSRDSEISDYEMNYAPINIQISNEELEAVLDRL